MNAAVVVLRVGGQHDVAVHVGRLGVLAENRVVVGGARRLHRAQRHAIHLLREQPFADQPVGVGGVLAEDLLLDHRPEAVGERLVERAGLGDVGEPRGVLGHAVGELVADHVDADREVVEVGAVTVAEDHLLAVPEGVVVLLLVVHRRDEGKALGVERVALERRPVELPRRAEAVVGAVHRVVGGRRLALATNQLPRQLRRVLRVVHRALNDRSSRSPWLLQLRGSLVAQVLQPRDRPAQVAASALGDDLAQPAQLRVRLEGALRRLRRVVRDLGMVGPGARRDATEDVGRDDPAADSRSEEAREARRRRHAPHPVVRHRQRQRGLPASVRTHSGDVIAA